MSDVEDELRQRERPGGQYHPTHPRVFATPQQILSGLPVGISGGRPHCTGCRTAIGIGAGCRVYAYRAAEAREWDLARCYCSRCAPRRITTPTLGTTEVLVGARVGVVLAGGDPVGRCCLTGVELSRFSPPAEGHKP